VIKTFWQPWWPDIHDIVSLNFVLHVENDELVKVSLAKVLNKNKNLLFLSWKVEFRQGFSLSQPCLKFFSGGEASNPFLHDSSCFFKIVVSYWQFLSDRFCLFLSFLLSNYRCELSGFHRKIDPLNNFCVTHLILAIPASLFLWPFNFELRINIIFKLRASEVGEAC